jgi:prenyl protein peptidase
VFQLGYTTLFGWFASYVYLRTGSVIPPLASHIFCNLMGIYLPTTAVARHPPYKLCEWPRGTM